MDAQPVRPQRVSGGECAALWLARDLSGLRFRSPGWWRGEAGDGRGGLEPVGCPEFAQDVRDVDADGLDADDERRGDLAVGVAAGEEVQDLRLARGQAEDFPGPCFCSGNAAGGGARSSRARWASRSSSRSSGLAPIRAATACASRSGTAASIREAPAAASASAWRHWQ